MLKLYFLKIWIKSLEKVIETSKRFSTSTWIFIAFICLIGFFISFVFVEKEKRLNSIKPESNVENRSDLPDAIEFYSVQKTKNSSRTERKKAFIEKYNKIRKSRNRKLNKPSENDSIVSGTTKTIRTSALCSSVRQAKIYNLIFNSRNLNQLTQEQRVELLKLHKRMLKTENAKILLETIQKGEGGGPLVIAGKGKGRSYSFKHILAKLQFGGQKINNFSDKYHSLTGLALIINSKSNNPPDILPSNTSLLSGSSVSHPFLNLMYSLKLSLDELKKYFVNPFRNYVINVNDKSPARWNWQFWILLFNGIMNAIASISAMILAWISNNRAKAEFLLKQAKDERDKLEQELKIKEMELQIMKMQKELEIKSPMIVLAT